MTDMTERVARAMCSADGGSLEVDVHHYRDMARATIEAMREPTLEMRHAGRRVKSSWLVENEEIEIWQNMIDEALK